MYVKLRNYFEKSNVILKLIYFSKQLMGTKIGEKMCKNIKEILRNYVYNKESTHIYYIIEGSGEFCINKEIVTVQKGDLIEIPENIEFVYAGNMKLLLIMNPGFKPENNIEVKDNDLYENR